MHTMLAILFAIAFVLVELVLLICLRRSARRILHAWQNDIERHGAGVVRRGMLDSLHEKLASDTALSMLQRMSVMAPLVGVVITAIGFMTIPLDGLNPEVPTQFITAIQPLFLGVVTGAVLALWHQLILQWASFFVRHVEMRCEADLPAPIEVPVESTLDDLGRRIALLTEGFDKQLNDLSRNTESRFDMLNGNLGRLADSVQAITARCDSAAGTLTNAADQFRTTLTSTANGIAQCASGFSADLNKSAEGIDHAATGWKTLTVDIAQQLDGPLQGLAEAVSSLQSSAERAAALHKIAHETEEMRRQAIHGTLAELSSVTLTLQDDLSPTLTQAAQEIGTATKRFSDAANNIVATTVVLRKQVGENAKDVKQLVDGNSALRQEVEATKRLHAKRAATNSRFGARIWRMFSRT